MPYGFLDIAVTPSVRTVQSDMGSATFFPEPGGDPAPARFTQREAAFIAARDSFFLATVSETGWPYVQHRGGAPGFLKLLDDRTFAFADYRGNRQYISVGNVRAHDRVCLFLIDYVQRARLKIYATAEVLSVEQDPELTHTVVDPDLKARPEHLLRLHLVAFDWNCPRHIVRRFTADDVADAIAPFKMHLAELSAENQTLRDRLAAQQMADP